MKGKRVHGRDKIDSYSLKISAPLIEDSLLHLVNLSIESKLCSPMEITIDPTISQEKGEDKSRKLQTSVPLSRGRKVGRIYNR